MTLAKTMLGTGDARVRHRQTGPRVFGALTRQKFDFLDTTIRHDLAEEDKVVSVVRRLLVGLCAETPVFASRLSPEQALVNSPASIELVV